MIDRQSPILHSHFYASGIVKLVCVNFWDKSVFCSCFQHSCSLFHGEKSGITKDVDKLCQVFFGNLRYHLVDYQVYKVALSSPVLQRYSVSAKKVGFYRKWRCFFEPSYHSEHLQLGFGGQSVSRFNLHCSRSVRNNLFQTLHCIFKQLIFARFLQSLCRI